MSLRDGSKTLRALDMAERLNSCLEGRTTAEIGVRDIRFIKQGLDNMQTATVSQVVSTLSNDLDRIQRIPGLNFTDDQIQYLKRWLVDIGNPVMSRDDF